MRSSGAQLALLGERLAAGTLRVAIDSTFALADAQKHMSERREDTFRAKSCLRSDESRLINTFNVRRLECASGGFKPLGFTQVDRAFSTRILQGILRGARRAGPR
ncbi:hypothetical protein SODG_006262 [Sodalis praecaptivus]